MAEDPNADSTDALSGELASAILESALDFAVLTFDETGVITSWSAGAEAVLGWRRTEVVGRSASLFFTPEDLAVGAPGNEMRRALADGRALDDRWHLRADGSRLWASGLVMPFTPPPGSRARFVKIVRDRTAEREAERRFNLMTAALPGFVWIADADGEVIETNERFRSFTARQGPDLHGAGWLNLVHPDDRAAVRRGWSEAIRTGQPFRSRQRFLGKDGGYRCFDCHAVPERDEDGRIVHWLATCLDVEDEQRARAALERLNLSLEHQATQSTANLAAAIEELQREVNSRGKAEEALRQSQKMEAVGQLTGGVAHDFNNLLTVIRSSVDLLRRPDLTPERRGRYLDAIAQTADRAASLTSQLLAFARRQPLQPVVFDIGERLQAGADILRTTVGSRIDLSIDVRCYPCPALADPHQFDTAVLNMVVNSRDAIEGRGRITITVSGASGIPARRDHPVHRGEFIEVAIRDSGAGIAPDQMPLIFEPFFTTKPAGSGTGLGLSQVIGFAKQSNGDVMIESAEGQGTTARLFLPRAHALPAVEAAPEAAVRAHPQGRCILVVEDNDMVGEFAAQLLTDLGYGAHRVADGQAALLALDEQPERYHAVFSDVVMPGMNGVDLAHALRQAHPGLPVVLTTGYSHALAEEGLQGFELLKKPYSADGLSRILGHILAPGRDART